jgi:curved DNA-binding protein CbpA
LFVPMVKIRTFYDEIGVGSEAEAGEIKRAFKELAKDYHPDHNPPEKKDWAHEHMSRLNFIVETLLNDTTRQEYDELIAKYQMGLDRPRRTDRQEYALQREYARVSVEIINLGEKFLNFRIKIMLGGVVSVIAILGLTFASAVPITSTLLLAFGRFLTLVGLIMAGMGISNYLGRGQYRTRIDELESKRSDLRRRMCEVWSPY